MDSPRCLRYGAFKPAAAIGTFGKLDKRNDGARPFRKMGQDSQGGGQYVAKSSFRLPDYFTRRQQYRGFERRYFPSAGIPSQNPVSYTHLRAHETDSYLVCRLLLETKKTKP